jgi:CDP-diacylglycerol pyrophosphatase
LRTDSRQSSFGWKSLGRRCGRRFFQLLLPIFALFLAASADAAGNRDVLWEIVGNCLQPGAADYCAKCRWPQVGTDCAAGKSCQQTTEVWAQNEAFVVLRDRKMCGCPEDFVHGLVVPRTRVTGVEDPRRPDGIWDFAWAAALKKICNPQTAALAVNPASKRAQDQLHVHIVRLEPDARQRLLKAHATRVDKLGEVWSAAGKVAAATGLADYGILVAAHPEGGFIVAVDSASPEKSYGVERCQ